MIWCRLLFCESLPGPHISVWRFLQKEWTKWNLSMDQTSLLIHRHSIFIGAAFLLNIQIRSCSSGNFNVFQRSKDIILLTASKVLTLGSTRWHGPKIIYRFTSIRKWIMKWWRRSFWFSKKIYVTFSSNWMFPNQSWCSQFLISSRNIDSSICGWKINSPFSFGNIASFKLNLFV